MLKGVVVRYAIDENECDDILQESFIRAFKSLDTYAGRGELGAWLRRVTINVAMENYRKKKRIQQLNHEVQIVYLQEERLNMEVLEQIHLEELLKKIRMLPEGQRVIFNLYAVEGYTHVEISGMLNISVGTSKSQYQRARKALIQLIEKESQDEERRWNYAK
ncbi:MAG: RNA polymerase sigma factor [Bacteroidetes bacterium]|nr:MAG: RNA polymerase sigma factor [Bacteroidota bacterium]